MLHALAFGGWQRPAVPCCGWLFGLVPIWQPFVAGSGASADGRRAAAGRATLVSTLLLGPWLLLICAGAVASTGGRVIWVPNTGASGPAIYWPLAI